MQYDKKSINDIIDMLRKNGHKDMDNWKVGHPYEWAAESIKDQWGGLSPIEHKVASETIRNIPVDKPRGVIRDLIITNMRVNHEKKYVTISLVHRSNPEKKVSMQVPLNHKSLKDLDLNEIYDVYGHMKLYHGGKVKVVTFHKMESL